MRPRLPSPDVRGDRRGSEWLRRLALALACVFACLAWFFITGEVLSDPGGLLGLALAALWTVPLVALAALAWYRPEGAAKAFELLTAAVVVLAVWFALDPSSWRGFENAHGPVRAIAVFVLMLPLALLAWRRPRLGGVMLLTVGLAPPLLASAASREGVSSAAAIGVPVAIVGTIYLLSGPGRSRR